MRQTKGKVKQQGQFFQESCKNVVNQAVLFHKIFLTSTRHNTLSKPLAAFPYMSDTSLIGHNAIDTHAKGNKYRNNLHYLICALCATICGTNKCLHFPSSSKFLSHHPLLTFGTSGFYTTERGIDRQDRRTEKERCSRVYTIFRVDLCMP